MFRLFASFHNATCGARDVIIGSIKVKTTGESRPGVRRRERNAQHPLIYRRRKSYGENWCVYNWQPSLILWVPPSRHRAILFHQLSFSFSPFCNFFPVSPPRHPIFLSWYLFLSYFLILCLFSFFHLIPTFALAFLCLRVLILIFISLPLSLSSNNGVSAYVSVCPSLCLSVFLCLSPVCMLVSLCCVVAILVVVRLSVLQCGEESVKYPLSFSSCFSFQCLCAYLYIVICHLFL